MRNHPIRASLTRLSIVVLLFMAAGCGPDPTPDGSATISWRVGGQTCLQADLDWVSVELLRGSEVYDESGAACEAGRVSFPQVRPGTYDVRVLGFPRTESNDGVNRARDAAVYEGFLAGLVVRSEAEAVPSAIMLAARKAAIYVNWKFSNALMCASNGVEDIEITVFDGRGNVIDQTTVRCDMSDYRASLPPDEQSGPLRGVYIDGLHAEPLSLDVLGLGAGGTELWLGRVEFDLDHGQVKDILVTLEACQQGCN